MLKNVLLGLIAIIVLIQFIPVDRSNPTVTQDVVAPEPVKQVLKNSCYDCHSNETVWPWYSYI
ncbi:heme-binding domain-containing protein, partial [candidate division KSB1 bacterium]|nr:heme-binding domain-containing protein [candidate division KSB1 bacterium]